MIIKINNIDSGASQKFSFDKIIHLPNNQKSSTSITGTVTNSSGNFTINSSVSANVSLICDRCLKQINQNITFDMLEVFSKQSQNDDYVWVFPQNDNFFDISEAVYTNILLNLPMKSLCSSNCKGLCFKCGHNLNINDCGCERHFIDPRFEKFLNLFKEE